eukprot:scaffold18395_cov19-Prasinocladus_malaysianus.AAC.1
MLADQNPGLAATAQGYSAEQHGDQRRAHEGPHPHHKSQGRQFAVADQHTECILVVSIDLEKLINAAVYLARFVESLLFWIYSSSSCGHHMARERAALTP